MQPRSASSAGGAAGLLGGDVDDARRRLGPPIAVGASAHALRLAYRDRSGAVLDDAVVVIDGVVVQVAPDLVANAPRDPLAELVGARIDAAIARLGTAEPVACAATLRRVRFGAFDATVADGRIVAFHRR